MISSWYQSKLYQNVLNWKFECRQLSELVWCPHCRTSRPKGGYLTLSTQGQSGLVRVAYNRNTISCQEWQHSSYVPFDLDALQFVPNWTDSLLIWCLPLPEQPVVPQGQSAIAFQATRNYLAQKMPWRKHGSSSNVTEKNAFMHWWSAFAHLVCFIWGIFWNSLFLF